jgi:hypothetical protein
MAARIRRIAVDENTRAKIQTGLLINRLTDHALGKLELTSTQIKAIEILIRKTLPDLSAVEMDAMVEAEVAIRSVNVSGVAARPENA